MPHIDGVTPEGERVSDVVERLLQAELDRRRKCPNPRCESWGCARHDK